MAFRSCNVASSARNVWSGFTGYTQWHDTYTIIHRCLIYLIFLKEWLHLKSKRTFVLQAPPVGISLPTPLGLPSLQSNPGSHDPLPCHTYLPWFQCLGVCNTPGPSHASILCQQWAWQMLSRYMAVKTPPWTQTPPQTLWSPLSLLMYTLILAEASLMYFSPFT